MERFEPVLQPLGKVSVRTDYSGEVFPRDIECLRWSHAGGAGYSVLSCEQVERDMGVPREREVCVNLIADYRDSVFSSNLGYCGEFFLSEDATSWIMR